jgi:hypothetical protein
MSPENLYTLIQSDTIASAMAAVGNDAGCAERCSIIAPNIPMIPPMFLGQLGIINVFANAGQPTGGDAFMLSLEAIANGTSAYAGTVKRMLQSMYPPGTGVDFMDSVLIAELTAWSQLTPPLISAAALAIIQSACTMPQTITADQISLAMVGHR